MPAHKQSFVDKGSVGYVVRVPDETSCTELERGS